jgi:epsilon-lactone hydrolase
LKGAILKATLKTISPLIANADISIQRKQQDYLSTLRKWYSGVYIEPAEHIPVKAEWFDVEGSPQTPVVLYFHGGAYVTGSLTSSRVLAGEIARSSFLKTLSFEYRLAPEHPHPAALEDALAAYHYLLESGFQPSDIIFAGESAGGGLLLATTLALKKCGCELPAALVCLCPWVDLTCTGRSHIENAGKDPLLITDSLLQSAKLYAHGKPLDRPSISPVYGEFEGFPPTLIQIGRDEILFSEAELLSDKMNKAGVDVTFSIYEEMWHVWMIYDIREAHEALAEMGEFIHDKTEVVDA